MKQNKKEREMKMYMNSNFDHMVNEYGLDRINTATKYPSILTYHNLGERGSLVNSLVDDTNFGSQKIFVTEKVDGSNTRIVFFINHEGVVDDYFIGTREDIIYANGDRIINQTLHAVETVKMYADAIMSLSKERNYRLNPSSVYCLYGENYGGNINGFKQYTTKKTFSVRFFDLSVMDNQSFGNVLNDNKIENISIWREHGGQKFVSVPEFNDFCNNFGLERVPFIKETVGSEVPNALQGAWEWLQQFKTSNAVIDSDYSGDKKAEGVVVRTEDRTLIRKLRFEDYEKTKKIGLIK